MMSFCVEFGQNIVLFWIETCCLVPRRAGEPRSYAPDALDLNWITADDPVRTNSNQ